MSAGRRGGGNVCRLLANHSTGKLIALICGLTYKLYSNNVALYAFKLRANKMIQDEFARSIRVKLLKFCYTVAVPQRYP